MRRVERLVERKAAPGIYRVDGTKPVGQIVERVEARGGCCFAMDGRIVHDKATFLREAGRAMHFPNYAAQNWDAFEELITDLSWFEPTPRGYVLLFDYAARFAQQRSDWLTAHSILMGAVVYWRERGRPFSVLLRHTKRTLRDVPWL